MSVGGASSDEQVAPAVARPAELLARFAEAHGLGGRPIVPMRATGIANDIWALGDDLVMRVGRDWDEAWCDARTETVAVPAARAVGVRTPALVVADLSRSILDAPVTVYERVHGETLGLVLESRSDWSTAMCAIGRELARLHLEVESVPDPNGWLDDPGTEDARTWLEPCATLLGDELGLFTRWLDRLEPAAHAHVQPRFLHDDVHAFNVMVDERGESSRCSTGAMRGGATRRSSSRPSQSTGSSRSCAATPKPRPTRTAALGLARLRRLAAFARTADDSWRAWLPDV